MLEDIKEDNIINNKYDENESLSSISDQSNDSSFSYNNMSYIESLLDNDEKVLNQIQQNGNAQLNQNFQNIPNSTYLINSNNNLNINNINKFQQLNPFFSYYRNLLFNYQIQKYQLFQFIMNMANNNNENININNISINKNRIQNFHKNKNNKKNKNNNENKNNSNFKQKPPKPENEIIISKILLGEEKRTFVRLSPIPNKYSPFDIINLLDKLLKTIKGKRIYNSIYVPLAKVIGKNKGYCFINLVSPKYVVEFYRILNGINLKNCKKPCSVVFSDKQNIDCSNDDALKRPIIFTDVVKN